MQVTTRVLSTAEMLDEMKRSLAFQQSFLEASARVSERLKQQFEELDMAKRKGGRKC